MAKKLILQCSLSAGDLVLLTAAVRDLHRCYPGQFITDVRSAYPELWENNPYLTRLLENDPDVEVLDCEYPLINSSNQLPFHAIHGFKAFLNERLGLNIQLTEFKGDIHLSRAEKSWFSQVRELVGREIPFWIIAAGGKYDYTIKWWKTCRYQEVVDHFKGKVQFVQVGGIGHHHPKLAGVIDLRGRTTLRQLIRLVHHAQGILCPVTFLMHLAAAVETRRGMPRRRPCVVVAGGREPAHWAAYAHHQFLHTNGALPCCAKGGCWRARTLPLGDGTELDRPSQLCLDVAGDLPRCMDLITSEEVIRRIDYYFQGGILSYLRPAEARAARKAVDQSPKYSFDQVLTPYTARTASEEFIRRIPPYPGGYSGRGIVICGGGFKYSAPAWVGIKMLRHLGCGLPIELWYLDGAEMDEALQALLAPLGVRTVNGSEIRQQHPTRMWGGWPLKAFSIVHSRFREVLLLDADNLPVVNPEFLFETAEFRRCGALFWPDIRRCKRSQDIWRIAGVPYRTGWEFESGQVLIDKRRCWRPLALALWYNEHADFFYRHVLGDKETFHLAFRKLEHPYAMPAKPVHRLTATMCQHDFEGHRVFQHRNLDKWNLWLFNRRVRGFLYEKESRAFIRELREQWNGRLDPYLRSLGEPLVPLSRTANPPSITAVMISCAQRDEIRRQTLSRLANTDWGTRRVTVFLHSTAEHDFGRSITDKAD